MRTLRNLLWWLSAAIIAIVLLEHNALLGLAFAVVSGVGLGTLCVLFRGEST